MWYNPRIGDSLQGYYQISEALLLMALQQQFALRPLVAWEVLRTVRVKVAESY